MTSIFSLHEYHSHDFMGDEAKGDEMRVKTRAALCSTAHTHIVGRLGLSLAQSARELFYTELRCGLRNKS